jgi:Uma2 family endonuclease
MLNRAFRNVLWANERRITFCIVQEVDSETKEAKATKKRKQAVKLFEVEQRWIIEYHKLKQVEINRVKAESRSHQNKRIDHQPSTLKYVIVRRTDFHIVTPSTAA